MSTTLGATMAEDSDNEADQLQRILENNTAADISEMWVVDDKGIVVATNDVGQKDSIVGKKNEYSDIDDFSMKQYVTLDDNNKRGIYQCPTHSVPDRRFGCDRGSLC